MPQPHRDLLDLERPADAVWSETEAICRAAPGFMPLAQWMAQFKAG